jgi:hypothetical protein
VRIRTCTSQVAAYSSLRRKRSASPAKPTAPNEITSKESTMNRHFACALVIATAAAGNAFADDITMETTPFNSTMDRAQVQSELQQARASGIDPWSQTYDPLAGFRSERTRAEVSAEYTAGRARVSAFNGEDSGSVYLARHEPQQPASHMAAAE